MAAMMREMNNGGKLLWIAPSGGRDRPDSSGQTLVCASLSRLPGLLGLQMQAFV